VGSSQRAPRRARPTPSVRGDHRAPDTGAQARRPAQAQGVKPTSTARADGALGGSIRSTCSSTSPRCTACRATRSSRREPPKSALLGASAAVLGVLALVACASDGWMKWAARAAEEPANSDTSQRRAALDLVHHPVLFVAGLRRRSLLAAILDCSAGTGGGPTSCPHRVQTSPPSARSFPARS